MREAIDEVARALQTLKGVSPWSNDVKASDEVLIPIFRAFSEKMGIPLDLRKSQLHELVSYLRPEDVPKEVTEMLDAIMAVARKAKPEN